MSEYGANGMAGDKLANMTPGQIDEAAKRLLDNPEEDAKRLAGRSRRLWNRIQDLHNEYSFMPAPPEFESDPISALGRIRCWGSEAGKAIRMLAGQMDCAVVQQIVNLLRELRELAESCAPAIDNDLKAEARALTEEHCREDPGEAKKRAAYEKWRMSLWNRPTVGNQKNALEADAGEFQDMAIEYLAESMKKLTPENLLAEKEIRDTATRVRESLLNRVFERYAQEIIVLDNKLVIVAKHLTELMEKTDTGKKIETYDRLTTGELMDCLAEIRPAYAVDSIVEAQLFDDNTAREHRESQTNKAIARLESIIAQGKMHATFGRPEYCVAHPMKAATIPALPSSPEQVEPDIVKKLTGQGQSSKNDGAHMGITIHDSIVNMGSVQQTQNLATGTCSLVGKETRTRQENKKGIKRTMVTISGVVIFLAALLECLYYFGWLDPIKEVIRGFLAGR